MSDSPPPDLDYQTALREEHRLLESVDLPIVTVSATTRTYLETLYGDVFPSTPEVVFSRAHYSMALGCLIEAYRENKSAWLVDPTNYVSAADWPKVMMTERVGKLVGRYELLKDLKNLVENVTRSKLPISEALEKPLYHLFEHVTKPILSLHYEAGNKLVKAGKPVVQVVTDPHVRPQYLDCLPISQSVSGDHGGVQEFTRAGRTPSDVWESEHVNSDSERSNTRRAITYCVFDASTKNDLLKLAAELGKIITPDQIIITGPPVDPRIVACRSSHVGARHASPLHLAILTGGVGTNYGEIKTLLSQLTANDFTGSQPLQLILYAGLHKDFKELYTNFAHHLGLNLGDLDNDTAPVRIIHSDSLVEANEHLINYVFPWADALITKPSGDVTYDAAAAAIPCLFLDPLGPWEENIQTRFLALGIGHDLKVNSWREELRHLFQPQGHYPDFFTAARARCLALPDLYTHGCHNIIGVCTSKQTFRPENERT